MILNLDTLGTRFGALRLGLPITTLALFGMVGCGLIGVEPDEIDVLEGETGQASASGDGDGDAAGGTEEGGSMSTTDPTGDPETTGDGDGDPATTGDGDGDEQTTTGDGDGDTTGDTGAPPCEELGAIELMPGFNDVSIGGISDFEAECGAEGPEQLYSYMAEVGGDVTFTLVDADFDAAIYQVEACAPLAELDCVLSPEALTISVEPGDMIYLFVDATTAEGGTGLLEVVTP